MTHKDTKIGILGDGGWGTTLSLLLAAKGYSVTLWGAFPKYVDEVRKKRENVKFLPGFHIPENVSLSHDLHATVAAADVVVLAVPSQYMRDVLKKLKGTDARKKLFVIVAKGIENKTLKVMSEVVRDELGNVTLGVLSGPTIARDVALKMPSAASVASPDKKSAALIREMFSTEYFTLYESDDVLGVQLGGSVKNVIAIAAGILQGMGCASNTRAVLFARGVAEMARLGQAMKARRETFMGLSGLGDLATTCLSPHSRNRWLGEEVGKGLALKKILKETEMIVEGVETARSAVALAKKLKIQMPITQAVHGILFGGKNPKTLITAMMKRDPYRELD
jgi:glycerol-3-phosphate dehydrogenase (NAD(P)+)